MTVLYKTTVTGSVQTWRSWNEGSVVWVEHGKLGGKLTRRSYEAEPKNVGKASETTAEQQAASEVESKYKKQLKSGYSVTLEAASTSKFKKPMKALDYKDPKARAKIKYPCIVMPKMNGLRFTMDSEGNCFSKAGEKYELLPHWMDDITDIKNCSDLLKHGGEFEVWAGLDYVDGGNKLELQDIVSAFRKPNDETYLLKLYMFDIPSTSATSGCRHVWINTEFNKVADRHGSHLSVVEAPYRLCSSEEEADTYYDECLSQGYEGVVYKNLDGMYEWNKRTSAYIKRKPRPSMEVKVEGCVKDKNGEGLLTCRLPDFTGVACKMRKDASKHTNYRSYENALSLVGEWIMIEYEEFSKDGVPTKPVGVAVRKATEQGDPLE